MKKIILTIGIVFVFASISLAASQKGTRAREYESFQDTGNEQSVEITLSSANVVSTVTVPTNAKGFRLFSRTNDSRFSIQNGSTARQAAAVGTVDGQTAPADLDVAESDLGVGGIAKADAWESRLLPFDGRDRTLYLRSTTANVVIDLEFF